MTNRTITELYQALRPLLLRDVAVAVGGSGTAAGGMETHALSSNWHTGQLAETQAPWAATKNEWATALATHAALTWSRGFVFPHRMARQPWRNSRGVIPLSIRASSGRRSLRMNSA